MIEKRTKIFLLTNEESFYNWYPYPEDDEERIRKGIKEYLIHSIKITRINTASDSWKGVLLEGISHCTIYPGLELSEYYGQRFPLPFSIMNMGCLRFSTIGLYFSEPVELRFEVEIEEREITG